MTNNPEQQDYIDRRVERALMFRALRKIRNIVDDIEAGDTRNRILAIVITVVGLLLFITLLYAFVSRHDPSAIQGSPEISMLARASTLA